MGAFGRLLIQSLGGDLDAYEGRTKPTKPTRIAECNHCEQISNQSKDYSITQGKSFWLCLNCYTYAHVGKCPCGHCHTHPYKQTGLTENDITPNIED